MPRYHTPDVSREQIAQVMDDFMQEFNNILCSRLRLQW